MLATVITSHALPLVNDGGDLLRRGWVTAICFLSYAGSATENLSSVPRCSSSAHSGQRWVMSLHSLMRVSRIPVATGRPVAGQLNMTCRMEEVISEVSGSMPRKATALFNSSTGLKPFSEEFNQSHSPVA